MRLLLLVAVVISACSHAVSWSLYHRAPDNDIILADRGIPTRSSTQALGLHRLLSTPDIYRTFPELAQLYSDSDTAEDGRVGLSDWRYSPHRVDPTTDTEPWSRTDVGSDTEVETDGQILCRQCDSSVEYGSSSSTSLEPSPPDENDEMKPVIRPSKIKRKQTSNRSNQYGSRYKRETDAVETEGEVQKKDAAFNSWGGKRAAAFSPWGGKRNPAFSVLGNIRRRAFTSTGSRRSPAFNSWGGKRSHSFSLVGDNTPPFLNSWGGKSNPTLSVSNSEESPPFTVLGNKRQSSFHSWGGKRDTGFSSWGGKRDQAFSVLGDHHEPAFKIIGGGITEPSFSIIADKTEPAFKILGNHDFPAFSILNDKYEPAFSVLSQKRSQAFGSWGGKRDSSFNSWGGKRDSGFNSWGGKRDVGFNSWGGKRSPGFSSWGGKRDAAISSWGEKINDESSDFPKRSQQFSSWGGKRDTIGDEKRSFSSWGGKRDLSDSPKRSFSSWGGKRDAATQTEQENNHHSNSTGAKDVTDEKVKSEKDEKQYGEENKDEGETSAKEVNENDNEEEDGRRHVGTQTSLDFQQLLEEFGNKVKLEDADEKRENNDGQKEGGGEGSPENRVETSERDDINIERTVMEDKSVGTTNTEEKGVGTSDTFVLSKRNTGKTGTRVSKAMFNPWGGKRTVQTPSLFTVLARMSRGIGKSDGFLSDLLYKRGSSRHSSLGSKKWGQASAGAVFSSWGGKRSDKESNLRKASHQNMGRQYRRGADFYSWGGKR